MIIYFIGKSKHKNIFGQFVIVFSYHLSPSVWPAPPTAWPSSTGSCSRWASCPRAWDSQRWTQAWVLRRRATGSCQFSWPSSSWAPSSWSVSFVGAGQSRWSGQKTQVTHHGSHEGSHHGSHEGSHHGSHEEEWESEDSPWWRQEHQHHHPQQVRSVLRRSLMVETMVEQSSWPSCLFLLLGVGPWLPASSWEACWLLDHFGGNDVLEIGAVSRPLIYTFYSGIGHVFVVRRGYVEDTSNTADIRYEYVGHTLVIRWHTLVIRWHTLVIRWHTLVIRWHTLVIR